MPSRPWLRDCAWWVAVVSTLCFTRVLAQEAAAQEEDALTLRSPKPGDVRTVVTGRGTAASVAMPDGLASMTPRWLVAMVEVRWYCADSPAVGLEIKTGAGPSLRPRLFDLRQPPIQGSTTQAELYLWQVADVKEACEGGGQVRLNSVPVLMSLRCGGGRVVKSQELLRLWADCRPSAPSEETVTGLTGSESERSNGLLQVSLPKFALYEPSPSDSELSLGKKSPLEFGRLLRRTQAPEIQRLRVVRLDAKGQVAERFLPVPLSGSGDDASFEPRLNFTPKVAGPVRFALEAEYADGSRLLSRPAEVQVLTPAQLLAKEEARVPAPQRMQFFQELEGQLKALDCGPALADWLKKQPVIGDAGIEKGNVWYRFTDGVMGIAHCH